MHTQNYFSMPRRGAVAAGRRTSRAVTVCRDMPRSVAIWCLHRVGIVARPASAGWWRWVGLLLGVPGRV